MGDLRVSAHAKGRGVGEDIGEGGIMDETWFFQNAEGVGSRVWVETIGEERRDSAVIVRVGRIMELLEWMQIKV